MKQSEQLRRWAWDLAAWSYEPPLALDVDEQLELAKALNDAANTIDGDSPEAPQAAASYYERLAVPHLDGSPIFKSPNDERSETEVSALVERAWRCTLGSFGRLSAIDWYATRDGRLVGLIELKSRAHASGRYETVFLNVRKWLALSLASAGLGVPALFIVRFTDGVRYIPLSEIDARRITVGGLRSIVKSRNDVEPIIEVEVKAMRALEEGRGT
jgi:hypothetical protein